MDAQKFCENCQAPLAADAPRGLCPACLMKVAMATGTGAGHTKSGFTPPGVEELARKFPQLEIIALIGRGGMGAVYQARQKELDRIVALKILPPGIGDEAAFAERFTREARALAKLNHPGIVTIHDFGRADGLYFFVMEFVDGMNLRQLLTNSRVSPREALAIVPQICDALQFAHDQGIVHRDIKPENILLDRRGRVKVADFGLAKIIQPESGRADLPVSPDLGATPQHGPASGLTDAGKIMGTPAYMAPEQATHPADVDHRADIYALGVVFYQMLTGELPGKKLEAPSTKVQIDVRLDEVVLRALQKEPGLRYQQVSEVKTLVETIGATKVGPDAPQAASESKSPKYPGPFGINSLWPGNRLGNLVFGFVLSVIILIAIKLNDIEKQLQVIPNGSPGLSANSNQPSPLFRTDLQDSREQLNVRWPVGRRIVQEMEMKQSVEYLHPGEPAPRKEASTMEMKYGLTVLQKTPGGGHEVELEILSARVSDTLIENPDGEPLTRFVFDTSKESPEGPLKQPMDIFKKLVGQKVRYSLNATNKIERMDWESVLVVLHQLGTVTGGFSPGFCNTVLGDDVFDQLMKQPYYFMPTEPVRPGDTWVFREPIPLGGGANAFKVFNHTLQDYELHGDCTCARLELQGTIKSHLRPDGERPTGPYVASMEGTSLGTAWFDPALGVVVDSSLKQDMTMVTSIPVDPNQKPGTTGPRQSRTNQMNLVMTIKTISVK